MSKTDNLKDFLTDVADAIRSKKGTTDLINPQNFSAEIAALSGGLEIVDMTETTATIEPNKVYIWGMVESLDITLGSSTDESDFFAFRFRCSKPTMTVVTINGATWAADTELDAQGKPVLDLGSWYQCEIKGGTSALYARLMHYIPFEDSNVEAVLLSKGIGDGLGVTYKDAAKVTSISTWFKDNTDITAFAEFVNFSGITQLIKDAFNGCTALTEIALPSSLTSIGNTAFNGCSSLTRAVNFENTQLTSISNQLFGYCSSLVEIILPAGVISISGSVFRGCSSLIEITLPAGVTSIGFYAFYDCKKLSRVINIENTQLTSIGDYAFNGCTSLAEIAFPASLTSIGSNAFNGCSSLAEISLPAGVTSIGSGAFSGCSSLTMVANLENTKVTSIGGYAFYNCSPLAEISLPVSLTGISKYAFNGCLSLARVLNLENTKVTSINANAFYGCSSLAEINFPSSLKQIDSYAFYECSSLLELNIPTDVSNLKIGDLAFYNCTSLSVINISAISNLGRGAFVGVQLSGVVNFENLTGIGPYALRYTNVTNVKFPAIITLPALHNYDGIFSDCPHLVLVDIGENCTNIGDKSFGRNVGTQGVDITLIVRASTPPSLGGPLIGFNSANIGSIFVPDASVEAYKQATNWSLYADVIKPLSEYTE